MGQQKARPAFCKRLRKASKLTPIRIYCTATILCLAGLFFAILASHGDLVHQFFFVDTLDTGMDFFHSIEYVKGRMPYGLFETLYPPLANMFFYVLYRMVPESVSGKWSKSFTNSVLQRGTAQDVRLYQEMMMLFILFVVLAVLGIAAMTERMTRKCGSERKLLPFCVVFSYGVLYGLERGNILLLCWPLMAFFIVNRKSKNPVVRELACMALAIAAGFKLYPAFLGILLLRDKNYMLAIRTIIYGIVCVCFPFFFFNEGLFGLTLWLRVLFKFSGDSAYPWMGNGSSNIVAEFAHGIDMLAGTNLADRNYAVIGILLTAVLLVCALLMNREWKSVLAIVLAVMMFQAQYDYVWCLFALPLCVFFTQESKINKENIVPYLLMVLLIVPLPLFRPDELKPVFTVRNSLTHIIMIAMTIWCIVETACNRDKASDARTFVWGSRKQMYATAALAVCALAGGFGGQKLWENTHNWDFDYSYNGRLGTDGVLMDDVRDGDGNAITVQWSGYGAYVTINNYAPFAREVTIHFKTGYGMNLQQSHTMKFSVVNDSNDGSRSGKNTTKRVKIEREGQDVTFVISVNPGQTKINLNYDGPVAVYDTATRKNGTFSVADLTVTSANKSEKTA